MNRLAKFLHEFTHPHCNECSHDQTCKSCETLERQLEIANEDKKKLLEIILERNKVSENDNPPAFNYEQVKPKAIPWSVRRQLLEAEDREKARILNSQNREQQEITKLEKEIGIASTAGAEEKLS